MALNRCRIFGSRSAAGCILQIGVIVLTAGWFPSAANAQTLIYQEAFETDGEAATPQRYTTTGRFKSEFPHDPNIVTQNTADQVGPVYWAHKSEVSIVGVSGPTSERRALLAWDGAILDTEVSAQFWTMFDATVVWLLRGKANATIVFSQSQLGFETLASHLAAMGHTIVDDDLGVADSQVAGDLIIKTSSSGAPGRFARVAKPVLTFSSADHDDMLVSTIGTPATFEAGNATIVTASHPAAGGLTGSFPVATGTHTWQLIGDSLPSGAITIANFVQSIPPTVANLADVDAMVAGTKQNNKYTGTVAQLDFADNSFGDWFVDNVVPGVTTDAFGLVARGRITVATTGTYSFALGLDDGGRLRIDKDGNGFTDADNVIVFDAASGFTPRYGDLQLNAGAYDFEVTFFDSGGAGGLEFSVSTLAGGNDRTPISSGSWELIGQTAGAVALQGSITVDAYEPAGAPDELTRPLLVLLNGPADTPPGSVFGGGAFTGFEGNDFFGGAALNKFDVDGTGAEKTLTLRPIDVSGRQNVKLTMAAAATFLDFETSDYLDVWIDTDGSGPNGFVQLIHFTAPSGADKYFDDRATKPASPTRLDLTFKDVTYDVPAGATQLIVQIRSFTSWFNEIVGFDNIRITEGAALPPPQITNITRAGASITITWANGGTLEWTAALAGAATQWTSTGDADGSFTESPAGTRYYRAQR